MSWEHSLESQSIKGSGFTLQSVYNNLSKVTNAWHVLPDRLVHKKQLKASIVSEEFYGLPAKYYGPQTSIELGIKNNSFKWFVALKVAGTQNGDYTL